MEQKVIQIGSSAGVTISKGAMEELGIKIGDAVETSATKKVFSVRPKNIKADVDPAVLVWTNKFIEKNRELLERLADK
jgi:antitoxin component of MazEF toxin-antitoxin module